MIAYHTSPPVSNAALNELFAAAWGGIKSSDFQPILQHSLGYICAFADERLVGFVNVAWDGGVHAFLLDTTVHPDVQRQGIGAQLVKRALELARQRGCQWVHVDFEAHLESFYAACGFKPTLAGLVRLA